jgi:hypothetical protein
VNPETICKDARTLVSAKRGDAEAFVYPFGEAPRGARSDLLDALEEAIRQHGLGVVQESRGVYRMFRSAR